MTMRMPRHAQLIAGAGEVLLVWLILFEFPHGASRELGVYLALGSTIAIAGGAGDYSPLRGAPLFFRIEVDDGPGPQEPGS